MIFNTRISTYFVHDTICSDSIRDLLCCIMQEQSLSSGENHVLDATPFMVWLTQVRRPWSLIYLLSPPTIHGDMISLAFSRCKHEKNLVLLQLVGRRHFVSDPMIKAAIEETLHRLRQLNGSD